MAHFNTLGNYEAHDREYFRNYHIAFMRIINDLTNKYSYLFPEGFRTAIEFESNQDIYYRSTAEAGNIPDVLTAKLNTVRKHPGIGISGASTIKELRDLLIESGLDGSCPHTAELNQLMINCPIAHPHGVLSDSFKNWLHQEVKLTYWQGAVTIPFRKTVISIENISYVSGSIHVGFSGAKEYIDLEMAIRIFSAMQAYIDMNEKDAVHSYNLSKLRNVSVVKYQLEKYKVSSTDTHFPAS